MSRSTVDRKNQQSSVLPLSPGNPVTNSGAPHKSSSPNVGIQQTKPKAGEIKYEWEQSVAKLNEEIKELRDAMAKLLADIRELIKDYKNAKALTAVAEAIASANPSVSRAFADVEHVNHILKGIDYKALSPEVATKVTQLVEDFYRSIGKTQSSASDAPTFRFELPSDESKKTKKQNDQDGDASISDIDDIVISEDGDASLSATDNIVISEGDNLSKSNNQAESGEVSDGSDVLVDGNA